MGEQDISAHLIRIEPLCVAREGTRGLAVRVPRERLHAFLVALRNDPALEFDMLITHTAIDWIAQNEFELLYLLFSTVHGHSVTVCTILPRTEPVAATVSDIWPVAHWQEREAFDLFGIQYDEHPDLRRLFLDDDWNGFPLRKDYRDDYVVHQQ